MGVLEDEELYQRCLRDKVHFDVCRFADDGANFSLNTDDTMVTGTWTEHEYELVRSWGLKESHLIRANVNAMKAAFLPEHEKSELLMKLYKALNIEVCLTM